MKLVPSNCVLFLILAVWPSLSNGQPQQSSRLSGPELVQRMRDARTRVAAFRELVRRSGEGAGEKLNSAEVIVCPQGPGKKPVYIVLTNFQLRNTTSEHRWSGYPVEKPAELFGPPPEYPEEPIHPHGTLDRRSNLVIYAFTEEGKFVEPFGGGNMLKGGLIGDLNRDGLIERADQTNYGVTSIEHVQVLHVCAIAEHPRPLLAVVYNWGPKNDWDYQFADRDHDGKVEIEFGPVVGPHVIRPKVVFAWDSAQGSYVMVQGKDARHVRVLPWTDYDGKEISQQLERWQKEGLAFPADPEAKGTSGSDLETEIVLVGPKPKKQPEPPSNPYRYTSLRTMTDRQIAAYMGRGKAHYDFHKEHVVPTQVPRDFWSLPAKRAAAALVDVNRSAEHRQAYQVAIDDRDRRQPPETCSIYYSYRSARCYVARDVKCFLRVDPGKSYLAYADISGLGVVFYNLVDAQPIYDLRCVELPYADAKYAADVIWWLRRARTWTADEDSCSSGFSTGDGRGALVATSSRGVEVEAQGSVWHDAISERWDDHFGEETLLNLADHLLHVAIPGRLGEHWSRQSPREGQRGPLARVLPESPGAKQPSSEAAAQAERALTAQAREQVSRLIGLFSADQTRLPHAMLCVAAQEAGDFALAEFRAQLQAVQQQLPAAKQPVRTRADVERLLEKAHGDEGLYNELKTLEHGLRPDAAAEELRRAAALALQKLDAANDPERLQAWAQSSAQGWQWALARLRQTDRPRYVAALTWWLAKAKGEANRQFFDAIRTTDPQTALELAKQFPADRKGDLTVSAYSILEQAKAVADLNKRIDALVQVALDPKSGWEQRGRAIGYIVPEEEPLKYPDKRIDAALVKLFDPQLADGNLNFVLADACRALSARGRVEYFDQMLQLLCRERDGYIFNRILASLIRLTQDGGPEHRAKLLVALKPHLQQTNRPLGDIVMGIFALDLRELKADLERISTAGPEDYEGEQASSYGGEVRRVIGRYHAARKVVAIWNEEDGLTRAKLLIAFAFAEGNDEQGAIQQTIPRRLQDLAAGLSSDQAAKVVAFVGWYESDILQVAPNSPGKPGKTELGDLVRKTFAGKK